MRSFLALFLLAAPAALAQPAAITLYCGGGVMVDAAGGLHALRQPGFAAPRETIPLPGPAAPLAAWQALLDAARFESLDRGNPGNMTCTLRRHARQDGPREHEVLWVGDVQSSARSPQLRSVVEAMQGMARARSSR